MLESRQVSVVRGTNGIATMEHHLVLHDHTFVPKWVFEPLWIPERTIGPICERSVFSPIPPGDYLGHLYEVLGEQPRSAHDILQPYRRVLDSDAPKGDGIKMSVEPTVVRTA